MLGKKSERVGVGNLMRIWGLKMGLGEGSVLTEAGTSCSVDAAKSCAAVNLTKGSREEDAAMASK